MDKKLKIKINAIIQSFNVLTKEITKTTKVHNLVVDTGLDEAIDFGVSNITYMGIGEGVTAVVASDTTLESEVSTRESVSPTYEAVGVREFLATFTFNSGDNFTITEAGLFDGLTPSGSIMFNRFTFTGHEVDSLNGVTVKITVTLTAV